MKIPPYRIWDSKNVDERVDERTRVQREESSTIQNQSYTTRTTQHYTRAHLHTTHNTTMIDLNCFCVAEYGPSFDIWLRDVCSNSKRRAHTILTNQYNNCEEQFIVDGNYKYLCEQCSSGHTNLFDNLNNRGRVRKNQSTLDLYIQILNHHGIECNEQGIITTNQRRHPTHNFVGYHSVIRGHSIVMHGVPLQQHPLIDATEGEFWLCHGDPSIQGLSGEFSTEVLQMYFGLCNRDTPYFSITKWSDGRLRYDGQVPQVLQALIGKASQNVPTLHVQDNSVLQMPLAPHEAISRQTESDVEETVIPLFNGLSTE